MIHQGGTHRQEFVALLHSRTLPMSQDFDGELEIGDEPSIVKIL